MSDAMLVVILLLKVTVILSGGLLAVHLLRRARAAMRHLILVTTFAAVIVVPVAQLGGPTYDIPIPIPLPAGTATPESSDADSLARAQSAQRPQAAGPAASPAPAVVVTGSRTEPGGRLRPVLSWPLMALAFGWTIGAAGFLAALAVDVLRARRLRRRAIPADARTARLAAEYTKGSGPRVDVLLSDEVPGPLVVGSWRSTIVLPVAVEEWDTGALRRALVHELEHVRRRDCLVQICARVICALYWFHPLVWTVWHRLYLDAERACDDAVLRDSGAEEYAEQLVSLARLGRIGAYPGSATGMAARTDLAVRVRAILDPAVGRGPINARATIVAALAVSAVVVALGPVQAVGVKADATVDGEGEVVEVQRAPIVPPATADRELFEAASRDDLDRMRELIAAGANVNAVIRGDGSPLIGASRNGHLDSVALLLDSGADPNLGVTFDGSPLIVAAARGHEDVVALLIDSGADVSMPVVRDGSPLIAAARGGHLAIVETLLDRGAPIDAIVPGDETALVAASFAGHLAVVRSLVERGADLNLGAEGPAPERQWRTPLNMAERAGRDDIVDYLRSVGARE